LEVAGQVCLEVGHACESPTGLWRQRPMGVDWKIWISPGRER
jgi:hypothetical protein